MLWKKALLCLTMIALLAGSTVWAAHHEESYGTLGETWQAAYNSGDAAAVAALYAEDGARMPPDVPIVVGRDAVQAQIQEGMDQGLAKAEIKTVVTQVDGHTGYARGEFVIFGADGNPMTKGKWVSISKYTDGKWQIQFDIWNYDAPLPTPEP
jgi:ketosteroid isomerase-like protein